MNGDASGRLYLGFDYGLRRIGVAVGGTLTGQANPLPTLDNHKQPDWDAVQKILREWHPAGCVVGLPLTLEGDQQPITQHARNFARQLHERCGLPVFLCDERLSSRAADDTIRNARAAGLKRHRTRKGERDGVAARVILEQFLAAPTSTDPTFR